MIILTTVIDRKDLYTENSLDPYKDPLTAKLIIPILQKLKPKDIK